MSAPKSPTDFPEWNKLAEETLTLWQDYMTATATDPKAKAELVKLAEPLMGLGQTMFAEWTKMLQTTAYGSSPNPNPAAGSPTAPKAAAAADPASAQHLAQLASRVAELERQLADFETQLAEPVAAAGKVGTVADAVSGGPKPTRSRRRPATGDNDSSD